MDRTITEWIFFKVFLVILLGAVKFIGGRDLGDNRLFKNTRTVEKLLRLFGGSFLFPRMIKNGRAILGTDVRALAIERRRGVVVKKKFPQIFLD